MGRITRANSQQHADCHQPKIVYMYGSGRRKKEFRYSYCIYIYIAFTRDSPGWLRVRDHTRYDLVYIGDHYFRKFCFVIYPVIRKYIYTKRKCVSLCVMHRNWSTSKSDTRFVTQKQIKPSVEKFVCKNCFLQNRNGEIRNSKIRYHFTCLLIRTSHYT